MAAGDELQRRATQRQRIDAVVRVEAAILVGQQQLEISGIDRCPGIDRQPPASINHRIGTQELAVAVDDGGRDFSRRLQWQRSEGDDPGGEGGGCDQTGDG